MGETNSTDEVIHCSFCNLPQNAVAKIIAAPTQFPRAYICDECVGICNTILSHDDAKAVSELAPDYLPEPHEVRKQIADCVKQTRQKMAAVYNHYQRMHERLKALDTITFERTPGGTSDEVSSPASSPPSQTV